VTRFFTLLSISVPTVHLVPFEASPSAVAVEWFVEAGPILHLEFSIDDASALVVWPEASLAPQQRDELWRHTCMELFIGLDRAPSYCECNVSPSGDWAFYYFEAYRTRSSFVGPPPAPQSFSVSAHAERRTVTFAVDLHRIHDLIGHPSWRWQPTAVLETASGPSYWAPSHPGDRPDFHRLSHRPPWDPYRHVTTT
jgi:hypothetical protein